MNGWFFYYTSWSGSGIIFFSGRLGNIVVASDISGNPITADDLVSLFKREVM